MLITIGTPLKDTLLSVSAIYEVGETHDKHVAVFTSEGSEIYTESSVKDQLYLMRTKGDQIMSGYRKKVLYHAYQQPITQEISMFLIMNMHGKLLYEEIHRVTGHGGIHNQQWHKRNSAHAQYTVKDEQAVRDICQHALGER